MATHTNPNVIPDTFRNFDQFPNSANVRQPVVTALFGVSPATVWRGYVTDACQGPSSISTAQQHGTWVSFTVPFKSQNDQAASRKGRGGMRDE